MRAEAFDCSFWSFKVLCPHLFSGQYVQAGKGHLHPLSRLPEQLLEEPALAAQTRAVTTRAACACSRDAGRSSADSFFGLR